MILLLFWLAPAAAPLFEETVTVPPGAWRALALSLRQRPAVLECAYEVRRGPAIRLWLLERRDVERFAQGRALRPLAVSAHARGGQLRHALGLGDFALVVDNRLSAREGVEIGLRAALDFAAAEARELPPERRALIVTLSLLFLAALAYWAARRFGPIFAARLRE
ncbi:MAG: hypothetical protein RMI94_02140 [Bryobacterales bacterium]|nr:hypothetical protein [Bryobacteraceae bacterium]MDW8129318.1 hypothetical protein [Bryobacterales bacterium]